MAHRIIICDDESHITRALSMKLTKAGFDVEITTNGEEAWEAIQRETPALIITDYQMPKMDGIELCQKIRVSSTTQNLPVILLTAKGFELDQEKLMVDLGIARVALKPFSPREILKNVQEALGVDAAP